MESERLLISNLQSNEITINLNMFMNDNDKGLKATLKGIKGKLLIVHGCKVGKKLVSELEAIGIKIEQLD